MYSDPKSVDQKTGVKTLDTVKGSVVKSFEISALPGFHSIYKEQVYLVCALNILISLYVQVVFMFPLDTLPHAKVLWSTLHKTQNMLT